MGNKLIIKQVNKPYDSEQAIEQFLNYIVRDKDTEQEIRYWKAFGASQKNIRKACRQFIKVQELAGRDSRKRIRHMVIIFPPEVNNVAPVLIAADAVALFYLEIIRLFMACMRRKISYISILHSIRFPIAPSGSGICRMLNLKIGGGISCRW